MVDTDYQVFINLLNIGDLMTKITFFSASSKDSNSRITTSVPRLNIENFNPKKGEKFILRFYSHFLGEKTFDVLFTCNREGKTLKTTSWPQELPQISVGTQFTAVLVNLSKVDDTMVYDLFKQHRKEPNIETIRTTYTDSISFNKAKEEKIKKADIVLVLSDKDDSPITALKPDDILSNSIKIPNENYKVYKFMV